MKQILRLVESPLVNDSFISISGNVGFDNHVVSRAAKRVREADGLTFPTGKRSMTQCTLVSVPP